MDSADVDRALRCLGWITTVLRNSTVREDEWLVELVESDIHWLSRLLEAARRPPDDINGAHIEESP